MRHNMSHPKKCSIDVLVTIYFMPSSLKPLKHQGCAFVQLKNGIQTQLDAQASHATGTCERALF